ncbi:ATP-dependent DNA helicase DinG [Erwinia sp. OLTSP20]|uniref:ATP-dependent DNA helicase DinG n=1 Tax=unclassified Erwinia TaxID=2622719 RepID=UPI000C18CD30|nr:MULTISPECIES: ATP-dependent DNA helicase DinG [unclassified Erwinia]PIJ48694.1 ATP-dependent DNA helicase DinG [Erwinia sp. OAMSP11]PIJ69318.1 ATP-dependent DNA helicase DinG [Erwinia sp. OLSSP12]PIJ79152.1 ATP-dependent DNA helicase DinG [Erwinia sp. OLCASP19]PIJ80678.1 ATP-dependent DNA helicase DinG [Erwinia sp. OLMTSP26]PIJ82828.1 ATP-dependent DNA helicase DinG [Erwinia sp. OLMDSP33]
MALTAALKTQIAQWYKALQQQIPDFIPRSSQRQMIAEVAKTLAGEAGRHLAIEAPTGVGKTLAYLIPGIAIGRAEEKPLVVSTANVALQDQIVTKDLPLLQKLIPDLRFTAAYGRGRYLCPRNLAALVNPQPAQDLLMYLQEESVSASQEEQAQALRLQQSLEGRQWDGLRDRYDESISDSLWRRLSTDKASCLRNNCHWFKHCPFFLARREMDNADVIVSNHALVMAALESDSVLPPAKDLLLVIDEGHHLPDVARDALEMSGEITPGWSTLQLDLFQRLVALCMTQFRPVSPPGLADSARLAQHCDEMRDHLQSLAHMLALWLPAEGQPGEYRFAMGQLPDEVMALCVRLAKLSEGLRGLAETLLNDLSEKTAKHDIVKLHRSQLQMSRALGWFEATSKLWRLAAMAEASGAPISKWVTRDSRDGQQLLQLHCAGIRVSEQLEKQLWRGVPHVVLTSATLRSLNSFGRLQEMTGLTERVGDRFVTLSSPFNHVEQGRLLIPQLTHLPTLSDEAQHLAEMAHFFRQQMCRQQHTGVLVLFASNRAMQHFIALLPELRLSMLVQGDKPRPALITLHRQRVAAGETSILVGLQSFAEGLDLKGVLLTQVHIHKIAFPPVDSPVILTEGEWLKSLKRYPFEVQSLPGACFNLIQQVGRLIRSHECRGEIIIYDRRLLTKSYGKRLLAALPVFPLEQPALPEGTLPQAPPVEKKKPPRRWRRH